MLMIDDQNSSKAIFCHAIFYLLNHINALGVEAEILFAYAKRLQRKTRWLLK
jgi:hypothetical protein